MCSQYYLLILSVTLSTKIHVYIYAATQTIFCLLLKAGLMKCKLLCGTNWNRIYMASWNMLCILMVFAIYVTSFKKTFKFCQLFMTGDLLVSTYPTLIIIRLGWNSTTKMICQLFKTGDLLVSTNPTLIIIRLGWNNTTKLIFRADKRKLCVPDVLFQFATKPKWTIYCTLFQTVA